VFALAALVTAGAAGSGATALQPGAPFDGKLAYAVTKQQVDAGPRPAGSAASQAIGAKLVKLLPSGRFEAVPGGLRNIVGSLPGRLPAVLVLAHYDTLDSPGFVGAIDSASGVGAVIALAKALGTDPPRAGRRAVRFLLTDGEEAPPGSPDFYAAGLRGSKAYASRHAQEIREAILLDFVALPDTHLRRDASADAKLWARLRASAGRTKNLTLFPAEPQGAILDDHTPFLRRGIPAIDLIDFDFPCWHQVCDDLTKVSPRSLSRVGATVLELVRAERLR
jgi:Peptidase family M28